MSTAVVATIEPTAEPTTVAICEHIKDNGRRCGTPAIRGRHFCYYHSRAHSPARLGSRGYRAILPETIESLQLTIMQITEALGSGRITEKAAGKLLFGVQLSTNLLKMKAAQKEDGDGAPCKPSAGSTGAVDEPVTELPASMQEVLDPTPEVTPAQPQSNQQTEPEPEPVDVEQLRRDYLTDDQLRQCHREKFTSNQAERDEAVSRIYAHAAAYAKLKQLGLLPPK